MRAAHHSARPGGTGRNTVIPIQPELDKTGIGCLARPILHREVARITASKKEDRRIAILMSRNPCHVFFEHPIAHGCMMI